MHLVCWPCLTCRTPSGARGYLAYVLSHLGDSQILPFMEAAVEARTELASALPGGWILQTAENCGYPPSLASGCLAP
jgi:hypothetical protein